MMTDWELVGFVGASGVGKTSLAELLVEQFGFHRLHMGQPIKDMLAALGLSRTELHGPPDVRAAPSPILAGRSPRFAMQTLGTDWGREMISPELWADHLQRRLMRLREAEVRKIVVDDLRFPEDFAVIKNARGTIVSVVRPSAEIEPALPELLARKFPCVRKPLQKMGFNLDHETEVHWRNAPAAFEVRNESTLQSALEALVAKLHVSAG